MSSQEKEILSFREKSFHIFFKSTEEATIKAPEKNFNRVTSLLSRSCVLRKFERFRFFGRGGGCPHKGSGPLLFGTPQLLPQRNLGKGCLRVRGEVVQHRV